MKVALCRAPAQRLDADAARSREEVEETCILDAIGEDIEEGSFYAINNRARADRFRPFEFASLWPHLSLRA